MSVPVRARASCLQFDDMGYEYWDNIPGARSEPFHIPDAQIWVQAKGVASRAVSFSLCYYAFTPAECGMTMPGPPPSPPRPSCNDQLGSTTCVALRDQGTHSRPADMRWNALWAASFRRLDPSLHGSGIKKSACFVDWCFGSGSTMRVCGPAPSWGIHGMYSCFLCSVWEQSKLKALEIQLASRLPLPLPCACRILRCRPHLDARHVSACTYIHACMDVTKRLCSQLQKRCRFQQAALEGFCGPRRGLLPQSRWYIHAGC